MWFISALYIPSGEESTLKQNTRLFGYYTTKKRALDAISENIGNMHECLYNYLVIEEIGEGVFRLSDSEEWFYWNDYKWEETTKPDAVKHIINFAF